MIKLDTEVIITYKKNGNIKSCVSIYDKQITNEPLTIAGNEI